jgi:hypothetical protein
MRVAIVFLCAALVACVQQDKPRVEAKSAAVAPADTFQPIDNDGIEEAFLDKASTTFYFAQGRWFEVGSSD